MMMCLCVACAPSTFKKPVTSNQPWHSVTPPVGVGAEQLTRLGPHPVHRYQAGIASPWLADYTQPLIYFPADMTQPAPAIAFVPGRGDSYLENPELLTQWGVLLASHGYIVFFADPKDSMALTEQRANVLHQQLAVLVAENQRAESPLFGKIDIHHLAVMGHSFGGVGALYAAEQDTSAGIRAVVALNPVQETLPLTRVRAATLIIHGQGDQYVKDYQAAFNSLVQSKPRALVVFSPTTDVLHGSMHLIGHSPLGARTNDQSVSQLVLQFLSATLQQESRLPDHFGDVANIQDHRVVQ